MRPQFDIVHRTPPIGIRTVSSHMPMIVRPSEVQNSPFYCNLRNSDDVIDVAGISPPSRNSLLYTVSTYLPSLRPLRRCSIPILYLYQNTARATDIKCPVICSQQSHCRPVNMITHYPSTFARPMISIPHSPFRGTRHENASRLYTSQRRESLCCYH